MRHRYAVSDFSPLEVEVTGLVSRPWMILIFRNAAGGYYGNGFGQHGGKAVQIDVQDVKVLNKSELGRKGMHVAP